MEMLREMRARAEASEVSSLEKGRGLPCSFHVWMTRVVRGGRGGMMVDCWLQKCRDGCEKDLRRWEREGLLQKIDSGGEDGNHACGLRHVYKLGRRRCTR